MVLYRRPPDGQWARTGTVDSSIVRFLLPIGGAALLKLPWRLPFHISHMSCRTQRTLKMVNGIMPPLPRRAMGPDRNCRQLDCPVPIAHRGRGSAEVDLKATFSYKKLHGLKFIPVITFKMDSKSGEFKVQQREKRYVRTVKG